MGRRHEDVEPAVAEAGFHAVLPALVLDAQQFTEDLGVRRHAAALELSVHGVPHSGGGVAVGVDPPASRDGGQLRLLFLYFGGEGVGALPCGEILLFQRLFQPGEGALELGQSLRRQRGGPERSFDGKAAALQALQEALHVACGGFASGSVPAGLVQCGLFAGQLFAQGVQRPALAAGGGTVGRKISPAGLGLGVFCGGVAGCQLFVLALSGGKMLLPGVRPGGGFLSTGQQGSASVDEGFRFLLGSFAAIVHDLFQRGGAGLGLGQHGVEIFQLHPVALQSFQIKLGLRQDVLIQKLPEVGDLVHTGTHLEDFVELLAQRACGAADAQRPADAVAGFAGAAGVGETAHSGLEVLLRAGRAGAGVDEGQLLEGAAVLGDIPGLVAGVELLHGAFRLDPDGDDKVGALDAVPELRADVGHGAARAAVGVLAALLGVDRALQGAAALFVAESVEAAVGGQAVADGVEDGGLAHGVDADHVGQPGAVEGDVLKVVPVDELQALQFYHSSTSTAAVPSSGRS